MGIVRFALKFPYTFHVLAAFILFLGISAIMVMPQDIFPEIDIPVVSVIWQYTGLRNAQMKRHERGRAFADRRAYAQRFGVEVGNDVVEQPALTIGL